MYLGITLDGRLNFDARLSRLSPRVKTVATPMGHLFKNIGGPNKVICRHYTCVCDTVRDSYLDSAHIKGWNPTTWSEAYVNPDSESGLSSLERH